MLVDIPNTLDRIKRKVEKEGQPVAGHPGEGAWESNGVKAMIADAGYSVMIVTDELSVYGEHGSGRSGYFRGDEQVLEALVKRLGLDA